MEVETAQLKQKAAEYAVQFVESGMIVGLGHGTTATFALRRIAELVHTGILNDILGIPCSSKVEREAARLGIPLTSLEEKPEIDLTIDGADEVDPEMNVIKGGGGALLREKIVAQASKREIIVVDESKVSPILGAHAPVPVEVLPFGWRCQANYLARLGAHISLRREPDGLPKQTDQGNMLLDCDFGLIRDPKQLVELLDSQAGIIGHGLFIDLVSDVIIAGESGLRHLSNSESGIIVEEVNDNY